MIPAVKAKLLEGKRGLIVGIANENSIAWGCAKAFRAFGAELAVTYLNDKAKKYVEPLARELEAPIVMPLDVNAPGQMEAVFERIAKEWGKLDFVVHSIAFSPKDALQGRVVDVPRDGFLTTMDVSCWTFIRMAHLAEPLMSKGGTLFTMTLLRQPDGREELQHHGRCQGGAGVRGSLPRGRAWPQGHPRARHLAWTAGDARGFRNPRVRRSARQGEERRRLPAAWSASTTSASPPPSWRTTQRASSPAKRSMSTAAITSSIRTFFLRSELEREFGGPDVRARRNGFYRGLTDRLAWDAAVLHELCGMPFPNSFGHSQEVRFLKLSRYRPRLHRRVPSSARQ